MIHVEVGDLAFTTVDAVVRPTTTLLEPTAATLKNLERLADFSRLVPSQELEVGAATVTAAGGLDAEFVIHAVIRSAREPVTPGGVRRALQSAMERASAWEFAKLAVPPLGVGAGNLSLEVAADIMAEVIVTCVKERTHPTDVLIVVNSEDERAIFEPRFRVP